MKKFKLNKAIKKEISDAIAGLPKLYQENSFTPYQVMGSTLIDKGVLTVKDKTVDPDKKYIEYRNTEINHQKNAEKEYEQGGVLALTAYVVKYTKKSKRC